MTLSTPKARESIREAAYAYPQSVLDAVNDAESLRLLAYNRVLGDDALEVHLANAEGFGEKAAQEMRGEIPGARCECGCGKPALRWHFAERAANAAFRAVPELRTPECRRLAAYWRGDCSALVDCYCALCAGLRDEEAE